jgi:hypothetical protein
MEPTAQDHRNAACRAEIAERFAEQYNEVLRWSLGAFGPGWLPSHRHFLLTKEEEERARATGDRPIASATVYTVRHESTGQRRHWSATQKVVQVV